MRALKSALLFLLPLAFFVSKAQADTYEYFYLSMNHVAPVGITASGQVPLLDEGCLAVSPPGNGKCYDVFQENTPDYVTATITQFQFDNGVACPDVGLEVCNGIYKAAITRPTDGSMTLTNGSGTQVFTFNANPAFGLGIENVLYADSMGDVVFLFGFGESYGLIYDVSSREVPEPSSVALLGTGVLSITCALRRRSR
jgi:hypothetical protein